MINQELVTEFGLERHYPSTNTSTYLGTTLYINTLGLQFWVKKKHFREGKVSGVGIYIYMMYIATLGSNLDSESKLGSEEPELVIFPERTFMWLQLQYMWLQLMTI